MIKRVLGTIFLSCIIFLLKSQHDLIGTWNILNINYQQKSHWSFFAEGQVRSLSFYDQFHYYEVKGGFNYIHNDQFIASMCMGKYDTYSEGGNFISPKKSNEFRIWPQLLFKQNIDRFKIEHRYRVEIRITDRGTRNRFRYRLALTYPFGKKIDEKKRFNLQINNEIFFTNTAPYFERNRFGLNLVTNINNRMSLLVGYIQQFDYNIFDETGRDFFQIGLYLDFKSKDLKKSQSIIGIIN